MCSTGTACHYYSEFSEYSRLGQTLQSPGSSCFRWAGLRLCSWTRCVDQLINNSLAVAACHSWPTAWARESIDFNTTSWKNVCWRTLITFDFIFIFSCPSFLFVLRSIFPTWSLLSHPLPVVLLFLLCPLYQCSIRLCQWSFDGAVILQSALSSHWTGTELI